ncbi:hypothetical protein RF11_09406 [Thelohanellus kitauei]|uniref:Uncharacterized protein n=1 Tax=Thelohanellus kitauei TaxID=669202 RepID=A0A0C2N2F9_THEKT|nr:hypothetical protein RF11_09406 [Thelohanellus kitauei]
MKQLSVQETYIIIFSNSQAVLDWRFIHQKSFPGDVNPADIASRSAPVEEIKDNYRCSHGPKWIVAGCIINPNIKVYGKINIQTCTYFNQEEITKNILISQEKEENIKTAKLAWILYSQRSYFADSYKSLNTEAPDNFCKKKSIFPDTGGNMREKKSSTPFKPRVFNM